MSIWNRIESLITETAQQGGSAIVGLIDLVRRSGRGTISFTVALVALSAKMAKADGTVTPEEIAAFRSLYILEEKDRTRVERLFNLARQDTAGYHTYAARIADIHRENLSLRMDVIDGLFHIARADGHIHEAEIAFLDHVASLLELDRTHYNHIRSQHLGAKQDPWAILEISPDADDKALRSQYHKLVREYHPDRAMAHGLPVECIAIANDRLAAINAAWDQIQLQRGLA